MTHVLVTRPQEASQQLAEQLDVLGLIPVVMPFYTFTARTPEIDMVAVWQTGEMRKLAVFTSPRAVEFGLPFMPPQNQWGDLQVAVVGSATRVALEAHGIAVQIQAQSGFTSEDLLKAPELADKPGVAVIFCAPDGRETIADGLQGLGWAVEKAMVYGRVPLQPESAQLELLRGVGDLVSVWTSISALKLAEKSLPRDVWGKILGSPALVISSRIQQYLEKLGAGCVELADGPGNPELLRSLSRLNERRSAR
ncbi:MAG: uroporphyrinogen-III synthase [Lysobacterales bacterium]